jgi:nitrogen fixation NifU-like protein
MGTKKGLDWDALLAPYRRAVERIRELATEDPDMPGNFGPLEPADGHARITGPCGDTMEIWIRVSEGRIAEARYTTDGCWPSIASGSAAARLAEGRTLEEAARIKQADVLDALGGLPPESQHCALLASNTLRAAVADYEGNHDGP